MISTRKILIAAILLLVMLFFINYKDTFIKSDDNAEEDVVFSLEPKSIDDITIEFLTGETLTFGKKEKDWYIKDPADMKADNQILDGIAGSIEKLSYSKKVNIDKGNLNDFGFEFPSLKIMFSAGSIENSLFLGDNTFNGSEMFAATESTNEVYVIGGSFKNKFKKDVRDYKDRVLISYEKENFKKFTFNAEDITLTGERSTSEVIFNLKKDAENVELQKDRAQDIFDYFQDLRVDDWDSLGAVEFEKYGLDKPLYRVSIELKDSKMSFSIGKTGNSLYIVRDGDDDIAKISSHFEYSVENLIVREESEEDNKETEEENKKEN